MAGGKPVSEGETPAAMRPAGTYIRLGLIVALMTILADQASKLALLWGSDIRLTYPWPVLPFIDLTVVWNRGISYGLFQQDGEAGRWVLTGFKIAASVFFLWWLKRAESRLEAAGLGLIIGGAIGNAIDRMLHGAVFDFVHFHVGDFSWYVFNVADAAIVFGVAFMLAGQFFAAHPAIEKP